ncbi:hypothetical protein GCM10023085_46110 [Actinomadura viridis]|uniref:Uncharacterized protein n=1 Tax=Actinomadura viridis TaxID=58110 RepID=A0A931DLU8_9ACTN|nr:hypothetical protein [Actinomadura viridis]MBG6089971.1 hypothetical protein [Actinomadura viridis]
MKITLAHRHYGVHTNRAQTEIPGSFSDYATPSPGTARDTYVINEELLISALPDGFLPVEPRRILLAVVDETGGTGQRRLSRFRDWAKYFDAYCLNLHADEKGGGRTDG